MPWLVVKPLYKFCASGCARGVLENRAYHLRSLRGWRWATGQMVGHSGRDGCRVDVDMSISH
jgi:hypothetical protein